MLDISKSQLIGILKLSQRVPLNTLEHIDKLVFDDSQNNIEKVLTSKKLIDQKSIENLEIFFKSLEKNFNKTKKLKTKEKDSIFQRLLSDDLKKDILFSCKIISQDLCNMELINKSFLEQAQIKKDQKKTLSIGQIMVKNRYIPVDTFIQNFRKIEQDLKKIGWEKLFAKEEKIRITFQNDVVKLVEEEISKNLGNYIIKEEVARGGMGIVYKAWDPKLKRIVALKILKAWEDPPYQEIERFQREAQLVARLNHPNIVNIYDAGEIEDVHGGVVKKVHYFTMDYIEGSALSDYIKENKLEVREQLNIIREIALALDYAHSKNIIHRDIKPGNILLNQSKQALLTDFGLAKGMSSLDSHHLTKSGETIGTPAYMSPEQARGEKEINRLSDIYSLGAVLYELITGSTPFGNYSIGELFQAVINEEPVNPLKLKPGLHPDIVTICLKAMNKKRELRYSSSKEMADDIDRYLFGEEIKAKQSSFFKKGLNKISKNVYFTITFFCMLILIVSMASFLLKDHIRNKFANTDYYKGMDYINYNDYHKAFIAFNKALKRSSITADIIRKLAIYSKQRNSKAISFLDLYESQKKILNEDYNKKLNIFNKATTLSKKLRLMDVLEENQNETYKNSKNLKKAFQNYCRSFICSPLNKQSVIGIFKICNIIKNLKCTCCCLFMDVLEKNKLIKSSSLSIISKQDKINIYLYRIDDIYLRQLPIPYNLNRDNRKQFKEETFHYLKNSEIKLTKNSYIGKTPLQVKKLYPSYYLIIAKSNGYIEQRKIILLEYNKNPKIFINLEVKSDKYKNFENFVNVELVSNKKKYSYFVSKTEVSNSEYRNFLNSPSVINRYKAAAREGKIIYIPRDKNLWAYSYRHGRFYCKDLDNNPVVNISINDAMAYCQWLNEQNNSSIVKYRLLTYREWQLFAGKIINKKYPWGNYFDHIFLSSKNKKVNVQNSNYDITLYGLKNMGSNVSEWCLGNLNQIETTQSIACGGSWKLKLEDHFKVDHFRTLKKSILVMI